VLLETRKVDGMISIATVYRTLNLLAECGLVTENIFTDKSKKFEVAFGKKHHDHLVCNKCQKIEEFHSPMIEILQDQVAQSHSFAIASHRMVLFGVCRDCR
jgi:Fur family ferric uptake transcriptional regulator